MANSQSGKKFKMINTNLIYVGREGVVSDEIVVY